MARTPDRRTTLAAIATAGIGTLSGCQTVFGSPAVDAGDGSVADDGTAGTGTAASALQFDVRSPAFRYDPDDPERGTMGRMFTREGANVSPPLAFEDVPADAETLVVVATDVGMPSNPVHWLLWNLPVRDRLPADVDHGPTPASVDAVQGTNAHGNVGYDGPSNPGPDHRLSFEVYAVPGRLDVDAGARYPTVERAYEQFDTTVTSFSAVYERTGSDDR